MDINIVIPVSRTFYLDRLFDNLNELDCPPETNLLIYADGDMQLFQKARNLTIKTKFKQRLCAYRKKGNPNISHIRSRRERIASIHNEIKGLLNTGELLFLLEDDTVVPKNALEILLKDYHNNTGFISGLQIGRWGFTHIGGWKVDDIYYPKKIESIGLSKGLKEVDAAGLYCCLVKQEHYLNHYFEPFEKILGPDVDFGLALKKRNLKNYVNHDVKCGHYTKRGTITFENTEIIKLEFNRAENEQFGWRQKVK